MKRHRNKPKRLEEKLIAQIQEVPVPQLLGSIELTIQVLKEKGIEIKDWDDKEKTLVQIRQIGNKCYFFAEKR